MPAQTPDQAPIESLSRRSVRQLAALRSTYPGWEIQRIIGGPEVEKWTAKLRDGLAERAGAARVKKRVEAPDAVSLASALSHQATLLHNARVDRTY